MKFLVTFTFLVVGMSSVQARSIKVESVLEGKVASQSGFTKGQLESGTVKISWPQKKVSLKLSYSSNSVTPFEKELPIISISKDSCDNDLVIAKADSRLVGGILEVVQITNFVGTKCKYLVENPNTTATYKSKSLGIGGKVVETNLTFVSENHF